MNARQKDIRCKIKSLNNAGNIESEMMIVKKIVARLCDEIERMEREHDHDHPSSNTLTNKSKLPIPCKACGATDTVDVNCDRCLTIWMNGGEP